VAGRCVQGVCEVTSTVGDKLMKHYGDASAQNGADDKLSSPLASLPYDQEHCIVASSSVRSLCKSNLGNVSHMFANILTS